MKKMYKNGLVLGKMYPITMGHIYLIDTAIENCDHVDVMLCHNNSQTIPGEVRYDAMNAVYKNNPKIKIHLVDDTGLPQHENECKTLDEFYSYWVPFVHKITKDLDVVFTSEDYGDDFARYLGIEHFLVDKERKKYPISGTMVRSNPLEHWDFIPKEMQPHFVKRIVIMGPESVGKSSLTERLANYFNTNFVIEYGRLVYENNGNSISIGDFIPIAKGRQELENFLVKDANKIIICDTDDITTYIFSKLYFPDEYENIKPYFLDIIDKKSKYDLYILLKPDCPGFQDGTRNFLKDRWKHYEIIKSELKSRNCNFVEIGGSWDERYNDSKKEISELIYNV